MAAAFALGPLQRVLGFHPLPLSRAAPKPRLNSSPFTASGQGKVAPRPFAFQACSSMLPLTTRLVLSQATAKAHPCRALQKLTVSEPSSLQIAKSFAAVPLNVAPLSEGVSRPSLYLRLRPQAWAIHLWPSQVEQCSLSLVASEGQAYSLSLRERDPLPACHAPKTFWAFGLYASLRKALDL